MNKGLVFDLKRFALHDGPGVRLSVFLKGCPLKCWWCHNPEGINNKPETVAKENRIGNRILSKELETVGVFYTVAELWAEIEKELLFFDDSGGGVTFSGGEPLVQVEFLAEILQQIKNMDVHAALDTSGFAPYSSFQKIIDLLDLILFDLKLINDQEHQTYTGVSNKTILENLKQLDASTTPIIIRFPVVPKITDTESNIRDLKGFLGGLTNTREITLLPFHQIASAKYNRFGIENRMAGINSIPTTALVPIKTEFESIGWKVTIGG